MEPPDDNCDLISSSSNLKTAANINNNAKIITEDTNHSFHCQQSSHSTRILRHILRRQNLSSPAPKL